MPQLGETITEGTITKWHKKIGEEIAEDEVLLEISTDKVDSEVPSPAGGTVTEILVEEGETVAVGTKIAVIGTAGEARGSRTDEDAVGGDDEAFEVDGGSPPAAAETPAGARSAPGDAPPAMADVAPGTGLVSPKTPSAKPATSPARPGGRPADGRPPTAPVQGGPSRLLSPVVRRLISEHGLDPGEIGGTGAGGRITRDDVLAAIERQAANGARSFQGTAEGVLEEAPAPSGPVGQAEMPAFGLPAAADRDTVVPFTNIRRRTAEHMVRSKRVSAHTMAAVEVDYAVVDQVRLAERERFNAAEGFSLTYLPFIARAVVDALAEWPHLNASVGEDELIVHRDINLGVAVDLDFEGLLVPVVHRAGDKRLVALAREIADLASRARSKRLTMDDISGGTFTLTNAGGFGTFITVPIINQPQVGIISTDGVRKRPVVVSLPDGSDGIAVHPVGNLVLSWDHRAVDGAYASAFMAKVRDILQTRDWSTEF